MTALSVAQTVCGRVGIPIPTTAVGSTDTQISQLVALVNQEGLELAQRPAYGWQVLQTEASFTTLATEIQGDITTIAPGLRFIINDTIWDRDLRRPVFGPLTTQRWQQLKAMNMVGPWDQFRIRGNKLLFIPSPAAGQSCYFEYVSKNWCTSSDGLTSQSVYMNDADLTLLDEELIVQGAVWRWRAAKGLPYGEDFNIYERNVMNAIARDASKDVISMAGTRYDLFPSITLPAGTWPL